VGRTGQYGYLQLCHLPGQIQIDGAALLNLRRYGVAQRLSIAKWGFEMLDTPLLFGFNVLELVALFGIGRCMGPMAFKLYVRLTHRG
jgi:hypothetical protein